MAVWFACHVLGVCCVQLNAFLNGPELEWCVRWTECKVVIADDDRLENLRPYEAAMRAEGLEHLILYRRDPRRKLTEKNPDGYGFWPGVKLWKDVLQGQNLSDPTIPDVKVSEDDLSIMLFSSGTTGRPKAIPGTNFQWLQQMKMFEMLGARSMMRNGLPLPPNYPNHDKFALPQVVVLQATPLFHLGGIGVCIGPIMSGAKSEFGLGWQAAFCRLMLKSVSFFSRLHVSLGGCRGTVFGTYCTLAPPRLESFVNISVSFRLKGSALPTRF